MPKTRTKLSIVVALLICAVALVPLIISARTQLEPSPMFVIHPQSGSPVTAAPYEAARHPAFASGIALPAVGAVAPYAVVLTNKSPRWIGALQVTWSVTDPSGRSHAISHWQDGFERAALSPMPPGSDLLVTPAGFLPPQVGPQAFVFAIPSEPQLDRLRNAGLIEVSVDGVILDDGQVFGSRSDVLLNRIRARYASRAQLAQRIRAWQSAGRDVAQALREFGAEQALSGSSRTAASQALAHLNAQPSSIDVVVESLEDYGSLPPSLR